MLGSAVVAMSKFTNSAVSNSSLDVVYHIGLPVLAIHVLGWGLGYLYAVDYHVREPAPDVTLLRVTAHTT